MPLYYVALQLLVWKMPYATDAVSCPSDWFGPSSHGLCFHRSRSRNYDDSVEFCDGLGGTLWMPKVIEDFIEVRNFLDGLIQTKNVWIGLHRGEDGVWTWQDGTTLTDTGYAPWRSGDPDDKDNCAATNENLEWKSWKCKNQDVLCQLKLVLWKCPRGWVRNKSRRECYFYDDNGAPKTQADAVAHCYDVNGEILMPKTKVENAFLVSSIVLNFEAWIGLTDSVYETFWQWNDGHIMAENFWSTGQPDNIRDSSFTGQDCAVITANNLSGYWKDEECQDRKRVVCQCTLPTPSDPEPVDRVICIPSSFTVQTTGTMLVTDISTSTTTIPVTSTTSLITSASPFTTTPSITTYTQSNICPCACRTFTKQELDNKLIRLSVATKVDKKILTSSTRKLTCADDSRPSARSVGFVGVILMSTVLGIMLILDLLPRQ